MRVTYLLFQLEPNAKVEKFQFTSDFLILAFSALAIKTPRVVEF